METGNQQKTVQHLLPQVILQRREPVMEAKWLMMAGPAQGAAEAAALGRGRHRWIDLPFPTLREDMRGR